jgi:hypothetical protein
MPEWIEDYLRLNGHSLNGAMVLALTRGLFPAPKLPARDDQSFDTCVWFKFARDIPVGCVVFTDGSLIDGSLPRECQSLGWAFAVISSDGDLVAAAHGVPPRWVDTIQGAELWAVQMALQHVLFPERLVTDCDSVRLGVRQPSSWAGSSKRRLARIWLIVAGQLDDCLKVQDMVIWMPAHTTESSIGQKRCSDGRLVSEEMWHANQLVDLMAKGAAESIRVSGTFRSWLSFREKQLTDLVVFIGKLTYAANAWVGPDGSKLRDADGLPKRKRVKHRVPKVTVVKSSVTRASRKVSSAPGDWLLAWTRNCSRRGSEHGGQLREQSRQTSVRRSLEGITARQEAAFDSWWSESRSQQLQPRDPSLPSAFQRLEALKQRLARKQGGAME